MVNIRFFCGDFCILVGHVGFVIYVSDKHGARPVLGAAETFALRHEML
jgi:hypothetical protein